MKGIGGDRQVGRSGTTHNTHTSGTPQDTCMHAWHSCASPSVIEGVETRSSLDPEIIRQGSIEFNAMWRQRVNWVMTSAWHVPDRLVQLQPTGGVIWWLDASELLSWTQLSESNSQTAIQKEKLVALALNYLWKAPTSNHPCMPCVALFFLLLRHFFTCSFNL
jgi:hypothetical protein